MRIKLSKLNICCLFFDKSLNVWFSDGLIINLLIFWFFNTQACVIQLFTVLLLLTLLMNKSWPLVHVATTTVKRSWTIPVSVNKDSFKDIGQHVPDFCLVFFQLNQEIHIQLNKFHYHNHFPSTIAPDDGPFITPSVFPTIPYLLPAL